MAARAPDVAVVREASSADPIQPEDVLALGPGHACVLRSGEVWCWGDNRWDQLGDPRVGAAPRPVRGPALEGIVGLAAGGTATCALLRTGTVTCWGDRIPGVRPIPDLDEVVEISVASFRDASRRCARRRNGRVRCWSPAANEGPAQDLPLRNAVALAGACAVDGSGRQRCFEVPAPRSGGVRVAPVRLARPAWKGRPSGRQIRAARKDARQHSAMPCVLRTDGTVGCWSNDTNIPRFGPDLGSDGLPSVEGITGAEQIASGRDFLCALKADGHVACTRSPILRSPPIEGAEGLDTIDDAVQVVAGDEHACARRASGVVVCWGANDVGQLGAGSFEPRANVVEVADLRAVELAAGSFHTCARTTEGEVWCWGLGEQGQLGDPFTPRWRRDFASAVPGLPPVADVALGPGRTCARGLDGSVWCWGEGSSSSRLGPICRPQADGVVVCEPAGGGGTSCGRRFGSLLDRARPRRIDHAAVIDLQTYRGNPLALDDRGRVLAFDEITPCGGRQDALRSKARVVATVPGAVELVARAQVCVRTEAGSVLCSTQPGQPGPPDEKARGLALEPVAGLEDAVALAVGYRHACALRKRRTVTCWGDNPSGQLGAGQPGPIEGPVDVAGLDEVVEIATGWFHTCARRSDGEVWCWGENEGGALGDGTTVDRPRPIAVRGLDEVHAVAAIDWRTCAWQEDGRVSCWGARPWGDFEPAPRPEDVLVLPAP